MADAVFPNTTQRTATFPLLKLAELRDQGGAMIEEDVPCSVWPAIRDSNAPRRPPPHPPAGRRGSFKVRPSSRWEEP